MIRRITVAAIAAAVSLAPAAETGQVLAHPPVDGSYQCSEHPEGQLPALGDALGTDCIVTELVEVEGRTWSRAWRGEGLENEDWFGWRESVLAPCDCEVVRVNVNPVVNQPGILGEPPASFVVFRAPDGTHLLYAHVREVEVEAGDRVRRGEPFARIGNNGFGRSPHLHIGAWRDGEPLQIRWDLRAGHGPDQRDD